MYTCILKIDYKYALFFIQLILEKETINGAYEGRCILY